MNPIREARLPALLCGAIATPIGGYAGYKCGKNLAAIALKKIYGDNFDPKNQSLREKIITKGVGGGVGAIIGGAFTFLTVATGRLHYQLIRKGYRLDDYPSFLVKLLSKKV